MAVRDDLESAVADVRRGRRDRFAAVVEACHVPIRALLTALVHDREDADDLAQQTFVFAYEHLDEYSAGTHFLAWLKAIARNHALDCLKRRALQRAGLRRLQDDVVRRVGELAGGAIDSRLDALEECVRKLPEPQREFLRLAHDRHATFDGLAARLGRSAAALRKQVSRLYDLLRDCMDRRGAAPEVSR